MLKYEKARLKTKMAIRDAFWTLFTKKDMNQITIHEITSLAKIHRATFYTHYHDIYEVLEEIEEELLNKIKEIDFPEADPSGNGINSFVEFLYTLYLQDRKYLHHFLVENKDPKFTKIYHQAFFDHFPVFFEVDSTKLKEVYQLSADGLIAMIVYFADRDILSAKETAKLINGYLLDGLLSTILKLDTLLDES